jgi:tripartite-type tricarboxylate transporter receptor subunit TctC
VDRHFRAHRHAAADHPEAEPVGNTPEEFAAYLKAEIAKWGKVIRESGATVD